MAAVYVALGDSMSIDDYAGGVGRGAASLLFRNRDTDFPDWAGRDQATAGYTAQILARDGAVSTDVLERQLPLIDRRPALVTITMGGNDLLAAYGDSTAAQSVIDRVAATGEAILSRLRALAADCRIIVTTVYDPSDGAGEVPTAGLPAWPDAPGLVAELNQALTALRRHHQPSSHLIAGNHTRANRGRSGTRRMAGGPTYACDRLSQCRIDLHAEGYPQRAIMARLHRPPEPFGPW